MLAGNALNGLLSCQEPDKGWEMDALAVVSLKIADRVLHYSAQSELPKLLDPREPQPEEPKLITTGPEILTP
jgi:hypothetical protein